MASFSPLQGTDLVDCARANASKGIEVAAQRCGYDEDLATFERELKKAYDSIGIEIQGFDDLTANQSHNEQEQGVGIAPERLTQL
jgi:hypothetical protein